MQTLDAHISGETQLVLEDYLEVKYSDKKDEQQFIIRQILQNTAGNNLSIHMIEGILAGSTLIIITDIALCEIRNLYILDRKKQEKAFIADIMKDC